MRDIFVMSKSNIIVIELSYYPDHFPPDPYPVLGYAGIFPISWEKSKRFLALWELVGKWENVGIFTLLPEKWEK